MLIIAARWILEGEQDYDDQTLATPTLQRVHVYRRVVYVVLVTVKLQWVKSQFLMKGRQVVYPITRIAFAHTRKSHILYFVVLWGPGSDSTKSRVWPRESNYLWIMFFFVMRKCVCGAHRNRIPIFTHAVNLKYVTPTEAWSTSASWAVKTDRPCKHL